MYKGLILKSLTFDLLIGLVWIIFGLWLVWIGIKNLRKHKASNPKFGFSVAIIFILIGLFFFYSSYARFDDYYHYLTEGDNYVKSRICKVAYITYATLPNIILGNEDITCADGRTYYIRYQHTYWRISKKGKILKIIYLPKSRLIVEIQ